MIEKRNFLKGMDGDISPRLLGDGQMLNLMNGRVGVTQYGRYGRVENIPGTKQISQSVHPIYGYSKTIGGAFDEENNRMVYYLWNSFGDHSIFCYDINSETNGAGTGTTYAVLYDSQVDTGLNFSRDSLIHSAKIINGILYWPDSTNNQPRSLNIDAAIKANHPSYVTDAVPYVFPLVFSELTMIKPPPVFGVNIQKDTDVAFVNNFIANDSFQFAFMYEYYTREQSVVGTWSKSSRLNKPDDTYNFIQVSMDGLEYVPNSVRFVYLIVRIGNAAKIIKTWDKEVAADAAEIASQNAVTGVLTYNFYNNVTGVPIPPHLILKSHDNVPDYAETYELAKNRGFLGNITIGHETPTTTSLSYSLQTSGITASNLYKNLIDLRHRNGRAGAESYAYVGWYVYLTEVVPAGWYAITSTEQLNTVNGTYPTLVSPPGTIAFSGLTFRGANLTEVVLNTAEAGTYRWDGPYLNYTSNVITVTGISVQVFDVFKNKSQYKLGVQFYDFAMRPVGGVVTNDDLVVSIPQRNYLYSSGTTGLVWQLSNAAASTEIPEEAYYYTVVMTLNLKARFYIESYDGAVKYATKDNNGVYTFNSDIYITGAIGIGLNTAALVKAGLGYTYQEGDVAVLIKDTGTTYEFPVVTQVGNYIVVKSEDIGNVQNARFIFEIYSPYKASEQEPFYVMGEMYKVVNPGEITREYAVTSDTIPPDSYVITRSYNSVTYLAEAMSPNDFYYNRWDNDDGKFSLVTREGRQVKIHSGAFSNVYIPGTANNGLNTFEAINQFAVPEESGGITKFILSEKVQDKGTVLLALCRNNPNSIYIGEVQVSDSTGATKYFAISDGVIGTINPLKVAKGCRNAESAMEHDGLVFWADADHGEIQQYSANGVDTVSRFGMTRFFKRYFQDYLSASTNNLDNINGFHHIRLCVDPFHEELIVSLPGLIYENYATTLPSYSAVPSYATSIINRFDIYDSLQKCMSYSFLENIWGRNYEYGAEWYEYAGDRMYGWKDGTMYVHNVEASSGNWNRFYGTQRPVRLCFTGNLNPSLLKILNAIIVEGNVAPEFTVAYADYPNIQITDLQGSDYEDDEGQFFASFLKDRLSPNTSGTADQRLYTGDDITDIALKFMLEFPEYNNLIYINFVDINYSASKGYGQLVNTVNT